MSIITITEVGVIGANTNFNGIDGIGIFGPAGASLVGQHFTAIFTGSDCDCSGGHTADGFTTYGTGISPVQDATLTINGITFDFGPGYYGDMNLGILQTTQVDAVRGELSISPGPSTFGLGAFNINHPQFSNLNTSGAFIGDVFSNTANVPGPIAGADLPGLLVAALIILGGIYWKHKP